ncbi:MAG: hypothetical protein RJS97_08760 [Parvibaculaceae bacterium]
MADVPEEMKKHGRDEDVHFADDEHLFRRFPPEFCEGQRIVIEALELPDMSVNRAKYGPPNWLLLHEDFGGWGVFGFEVGHIPAEFVEDGVTKYTFGPKHRPLKNNYPHSEVRAYRDGEHIDAKKSELLLDPEAHQRWRQRLAWKCKIVIQPSA